jgi:hypothetical protein
MGINGEMLFRFVGTQTDKKNRYEDLFNSMELGLCFFSALELSNR